MKNKIKFKSQNCYRHKINNYTFWILVKISYIKTVWHKFSLFVVLWTFATIPNSNTLLGTLHIESKLVAMKTTRSEDIKSKLNQTGRRQASNKPSIFNATNLRQIRPMKTLSLWKYEWKKRLMTPHSKNLKGALQKRHSGQW